MKFFSLCRIIYVHFAGGASHFTMYGPKLERFVNAIRNHILLWEERNIFRTLRRGEYLMASQGIQAETVEKMPKKRSLLAGATIDGKIPLNRKKHFS